MPRKLTKTNPMLTATIQSLKKAAYDNDAHIWKDVACRLERPLRNWPEVHLSRIDQYVAEKEIALVPGKVLSPGNLSKKVSVAAWAFSEKSKEKIEAAGGKVMTIEELVAKNPKGTGVRILG